MPVAIEPSAGNAMAAKKTWNRWSPEMDARLKEVYQTDGILASIAALGKSRSAIKNRARTLGLKRPDRRWLPHEEELIRTEYPKGESAASLAAKLNRGIPAIRRRAFLLGVINGRFWSEAEKEAVRTRYRTDGAKSLARELLGATDSHSVWLIYRLAEKLKVTVPIRHPKEVYEQVRLLHSQGLNDSKIAKQMRGYFHGKNDRERVTAIRRRLKLPAIVMSPEERIAMGRKGRIKQIESGENPRNKAFRQFAEKYGLPGDTPPRAVEILLALTSGPKTRSTLHQMTGKDPVSLWNALGTSYLGGLFIRGMVAKTKLDGATKRGDRVMYILTSQAMDLLAKGKNK